MHRFAAKAGELPYLVQFAIPAQLTCWFVKKRKDAEGSLPRTSFSRIRRADLGLRPKPSPDLRGRAAYSLP
jgi:hypothetical protein